ncbi:MAG: histidine phosphatase family protein [Thermoanaerobaculia bacterium]
MKLLLLRHAIAEDRATFAASGKEDRLRPLTDDGRKKMRKIAEAIASLLPEVTLIATSPYLRCRESAEILARACPERPVLSERAELAATSPSAALLKFLQAQKSLPLVACVGHEPNLSQLAGWLLAGQEKSFLELRKGGACLLDFAGRLAPGNATLLWHLTPSQLRALRSP